MIENYTVRLLELFVNGEHRLGLRRRNCVRNFQPRSHKLPRQDLKWSLQEIGGRPVVTYRAHLLSPYTDIKRVGGRMAVST